ncbi:MAG: hypothetical protein NTX72_03395 [Candidatus Uhrbacteria bacterium]|nr:hypothetical protein [Candidatus Uhrbacteria bacterium]
MELAEAYNQLFGDDPSLATQEALELFQANQNIDALDDQQFMSIAESAVNRYRTFAEDRSLYVDSLDHTAQKALLADLTESESMEELEEPPEAEAEPPPIPMEIAKPAGGTINIDALRAAQRGIPEMVIPKPQTDAERDEGRVPYIRAVNPANLEGMLAAAKTGGKKKTTMADKDTDGPSPDLEIPPPFEPLVIDVPPVVKNLNVPIWIQRLHKDEYYQMIRQKMEEAFAACDDEDPDTRKWGEQHFEGWKRRAREQKEGCTGPEFKPHGSLLQKCIYDLLNGADPKSTDYIRYYVGP